eukprot:7904544-Alexandrium_andersonii.AAC.1
MSASLVGSEMCIRDRKLSERARIFPLPGMNCTASSSSGPGRGGILPLPVSYTHLTLPTICSV